MISRRTILLKPMQPGLTGYVRLQAENGRTALSLHARGAEEGAVRLYVCLGGLAAQEAARVRANPRGEIAAQVDLACELNRLQGIVLIREGDAPVPLLIGVCQQQSAGDALEIRNAALALCDRLRPRPPEPEPAAPPAPAPQPVQRIKRPAPQPELPREIFLPAIDPAPYLAAVEPAPEPEPDPPPEPILPPPRPCGPPVDRLRPLQWPRGFEMLKPYFEREKPCALFPLRGWRFVPAARGLWIGIQTQDGCVRSVAYACQGTKPPPAAGKYHPMKGTDGQWYQVLRQEM